MIEIRVPELAESVVEATVSQWMKKPGDAVKAGEALLELETEKVNLEVAAEQAGVLSEIVADAGADVEVGDLLGKIAPAGTAVASTPAPAAPAQESAPAEAAPKSTPMAQKVAQEHGVNLADVQASGSRINKGDVQAHVAAAQQPAPVAPPPAPAKPAAPPPPPPVDTSREERVRMTRRRKTIARRLLEAQQTAAILTTFNEVDMSSVMNLRKRRQEGFVDRNGIKLGFSSFFVKATVAALKAFPAVNAEISGEEIVYKHYYDIGIAVGSPQGLVVPVIRDADRLSFAQIEKGVKAFAGKAKDGSLSMDDLRGGTFTITNGGVFGSMMSTPILNPPQVGILGLHNIVKRAVVVNDEIVIRPMMYIALSYDHRIIDGREAVQFLVRIKQLIEDPEALLLEG